MRHSPVPYPFAAALEIAERALPCDVGWFAVDIFCLRSKERRGDNLEKRLSDTER
jgi:hypothetical protein